MFYIDFSFILLFHVISSKMPLDYSDPLMLKIIIERNEKDSAKSLRWFLKNKEVIASRAKFTEAHKQYTEEQIARKNIDWDIAGLSKHYEACGRNRRKRAQMGETSLNYFSMKAVQPQVPIMKSVDPNESSILYKEMAVGGGRAAYLKMRKYKMPEEKYNSCETSNVYGWRLGESEIALKAPEYKRYATFLHDLHRNSGVHPDPIHYAPPAEIIYMRCAKSQ